MARITRTVTAAALVAAIGFVGVLALDANPQGTATEATPATAEGDEAALAFAANDTGTHGSEVTLGVTSEGAIFVGGWDAIGRSTDGGATWEQVSIGLTHPLAADRVLVVDEDTDRVYVDDTTLACTVLSWSDDLGDTWTTNPLACGGGATDHQKIAVGPRTALEDPTGEAYPNVVYVCANGLTHTPCTASPDGGRTFGPGVPSQQLDAEDEQVQTTCAFQGMPVTDEEGTVYQPHTQCGAAVWSSEDNGLTWTRETVPVSVSEDTADVAAAEGALSFAYTDDAWTPKLAYSADDGETWADPIELGPSNLTSALFTVATMESASRAGFAYYATYDDAAGWGGNPGNAPGEVTWHLFAGVVTGLDTSDPAVHAAQVTTEADPIQRGPVSKLGSGLNNIADYIDVTHGPDGRVHVGYVDGCDVCEDASSSTADDAYVAVQTDGPLVR